MWSKITSHLGVWLGLEEERPMRSSCSLSMLHNPQLSVVRNSRSSDNLHKVCTLQEPVRPPKNSVFTLRRSRNKEKKHKHTMPNGMAAKVDSMTQSWHSQAHHQTSTPTKNIFSFLKPSRSRSNHGVEPLSAVVSASHAPPATVPAVSVVDAPRRRRPRSAHFDPNAIHHGEIVDDFPQQDVDQLYERLEKLGEGSYATVFKCESKLDGSIVALKEIKLQFQEGLPFTAIREASLLRTLRHANIVCLHDIYLKHNQLTFVFEYMKMDLSKYLEARPMGLDASQTRVLVFQLLRGLDFCHKKKILHRDLKPQNLLLDGEGTLKLADFGLARAKSVPSRTYSNEVVTLWYRPPDVLLGNTEYNTSLDMWGVGCIFAEICTGQPLFPGQKDVADQLDKIFSVRGLPDPAKWPEVLRLPHYVPSVYPPYREVALVDVNSQLARLQRHGLDLLLKFLQLRPDERVSASAAMMHPYFGCLPREILLLPPTQSIFSLPELQR